MALGKHKYYCEMCQKQCKDENAFSQHKKSYHHTKMMGNFSERPQFFTGKYSKEFEEQFVDNFKIMYGKNIWIIANKAYNEMIRDPHHTHLNATRWDTLGAFTTYLSFRNEGKDFEKRREVIGGIEHDMLLMIDRDLEAQRLADANKVCPKELDRKRE